MTTSEIQITTTSPKGQVVIPQEIRQSMGIGTGTKFAVYGDKDTIVFKRLELPTVEDFKKIARFGKAFARKKGVKQRDVLKDD